VRDVLHCSSPPVTEVTAAIEVEAGTSTFRVRCTSTGGRALNMAVSGPNGYNSHISANIQPIGTPLFLSNDRYTARTDVISSGRDGDVFQCNVTSLTSTVANVAVRGKDFIWTISTIIVLFYCSCCSNHNFTGANSSHYC
jgi:hypothetical protein